MSRNVSSTDVKSTTSGWDSAVELSTAESVNSGSVVSLLHAAWRRKMTGEVGEVNAARGSVNSVRAKERSSMIFQG